MAAPATPGRRMTERSPEVSRSLDVFERADSLLAHGCLDIRFGEPLDMKRRQERAPVVDERGVGLDEPCHTARPSCAPRDRVLQPDQGRKRHHAIDDRDVPRDHERGEDRAERDGDDQVKRVQLRERPLARNPQEDEERDIPP